jgi:hypothetical protein
VHAQSRSSIDFDDHSALALQGLRYVLDHHIDPSDIQSDDACSFDCMTCNIGMDLIGHIGCGSSGAQVGIASDENFLANGWNGIWSHALIHQNPEGHRIDFDQAQGGRVSIASAWIFIDFVDQFLDGRLTIADHVGRFAPSGSDEFSSDD